jgi:hypothetical protein
MFRRSQTKADSDLQNVPTPYTESVLGTLEDKWKNTPFQQV